MWNDVKAAIQASHLWDVILLTGLLYSVNEGPYEGASFWREAQEAAELYSKTSGTDCPLLQHLLPRIAKERGEEDQLLHRRGLFVEDSKVLHKGPKVSTSRWRG